MSLPELEELARLIPQQDGGRYLWQDYVERITERLEGLPAPDGEGSFVSQCLAAGCQAVGSMRRNRLWEARAPDHSEGTERGVYELRIRLGLFHAASLRYLAHGLCRLRIATGSEPWQIWQDELTAGEVSWRPLMGGGGSFEDYAVACGKAPEITWEDKEPTHAQAGFVANRFFMPQEMILVTLELSLDVLAFVQPGRLRGLFGRMLIADGQVEAEKDDAVDVAAVFLEALVEAVERKVLPVNTRADGHVFVTPEFWLLTSPIGLDCVRDLLSSRRKGRRYNFARQEVFRALNVEGHLVGVGYENQGKEVRVYEIDVEGWTEPLELRGLAIAVHSLAVEPNMLPPFEGTVRFKREIGDGSNEN